MHLRAILIAVLAASPVLAQSAQKQEFSQAAWTKAFPSKLTSHSAALPPVVFSPELSVEENNARLAERDPAGYMLATVSVHPRALGSIKDLVGKECSLQIPSEFPDAKKRFHGEVFAFTLSPDRSELTLYVRVSNQRDASGAWLLAPGQQAELKVASSAAR